MDIHAFLKDNVVKFEPIIILTSVSMYNVIFLKRNQVRNDKRCHHTFKITLEISSPDKTRCTLQMIERFCQLPEVILYRTVGIV